MALVIVVSAAAGGIADNWTKIVTFVQKVCPKCPPSSSPSSCAIHSTEDVLRVVRELVKRYDRAVDKPTYPVPPDYFAAVDESIDCLLEQDASNGHALYFRGTVNRYRKDGGGPHRLDHFRGPNLCARGSAKFA